MSDRSAPTEFQVRIYYEDTDATGVVYHANYLKYFERARSEWLAAAGFDLRSLAVERGLGFTLAKIDVDFRRPARLGDDLRVVSVLAHAGRARLVFEQIAYRGPAALVCARSTVACVVIRSFLPTRLPTALR